MAQDVFGGIGSSPQLRGCIGSAYLDNGTHTFDCDSQRGGVPEATLDTLLGSGALRNISIVNILSTYK